MKEYGILDRMPFGKYGGSFVATVIEEDPQYIEWALEKTTFRLDEEALEYLKECARS